MIDLRSDVKTLPTDLMRQAISAAELGDDLAGEDPTVNALEARVAGLMAHTLPGHYGALNPDDVAAAIWPPNIHAPAVGLVALENTHNRAGGTCLSVEQTTAVCEVAHRHDVPVHIEGARIFDAAVALGVAARELAAPADSVTFCLSKSLGAPVGSLVCGDAEFIEQARQFRNILGGGMRQAGIIAAAGLVALEDELPRLHEDHAKARRLGDALAQLPGVKLDMATVQTNMVLFELHRDDMTAPQFCQRLADYGINARARSAVSIRFVTHRDISFDDIDKVCAALREALA